MTHILNGKTLLDIQVSKDKEAIKFVTTEGDIYAIAEGDCCSRSWVETIESTLLDVPAVVYEALDIGNMKEPVWSDSGHDLYQYYGFKITTDRGEIVVDYRNESNGYYGGYLVWEADYGYRNSVKDKEFASILPEPLKEQP